MGRGFRTDRRHTVLPIVARPTEWSGFTARCIGMGGCRRRFRIRVDALEAAVTAARLDGVQGREGGELTLEEVVDYCFDFCLGCVTGESPPGEYIPDDAA